MLKLSQALFLLASLLVSLLARGLELPQDKELPILMVKPASQNIVVSKAPYALILNSFKREGDEVSVLLEGNVDAHDFQMRPSHLKKIAEADIVIWGGETLEPYLAKALGNKQRQLRLQDINNLHLIPGQSHKASADPHIWFSEKNSLLIVKAMAEALYYPKQATQQLEMRSALNSAIAEKRKINSKKLLLVDHDAYSYLEEEMGLSHHFVIQEHHNAKPGLKHWQSLRKLLIEAKNNERSVCVLTAPAFQDSQEGKKTFQMMKDFSLQYSMAAIDPLGLQGAKEYQNYFEFLNESRASISACLQE